MHTHFDGQVTWDPLLTPTCWHGVTTIVMGNCGVGFAPVQPDKHDWLIGLMEGVEDIPGAALSEGIQWGWETFPEYLDAVDRAPKMLDVGAQVPHGAVRGVRDGGARREERARDRPTTSRRWRAIVREGIEAGALGFSTSRTIAHMAIDGEPVPGTFAAEDELFGIGRVLGELGTGVFELAPAGALGEDLAAPEREMAWMRKLSAAIGRPVTFALTQNDHDPESWRRMLELCAQAAAEGAQVAAAGRGPAGEPAARAADLPPVRVLPVVGADRRGAARGEGRGDARSRAARAKLLAEVDAAIAPMRQFLDPERAFPIGDAARLRARARATASPASRARAGPRRRWRCSTTCCSTTTAARSCCARCSTTPTSRSTRCARCCCTRRSAWGLGDGGAHCGTTCDASTPTFMLTHWARDRAHDRLPLEWVVKKMTADTASLYGLGDRGALAPGKLGDVNVIDFDHAAARTRPRWCTTCPADARRFVQRAAGLRRDGEVAARSSCATATTRARARASCSAARADVTDAGFPDHQDRRSRRGAGRASRRPPPCFLPIA